MTVKGGTTPACAACKFQRRKCTPNCPLAPYFPANQLKMFQNVHRLFGVSNVTKTLKSLKTKDQKEDAMKSIIYEAEMRERFPVYGCSVIICQLRYQLQCAIHELQLVQSQLALFREQSQSVNNSNNQFLLNDGSGGFYGDSCLENSNLTTTIQSQLDALSIFQDNRNNIFPIDFEGGGFVNMRMEDRQSYIDTKEPFESSSESSMKNPGTMHLSDERMSSRELKTAAADFSLTTFN